MSDIQKITQSILAFRDARNWKQFHNPKDMAISLVLEAAEVMEHFQWKSQAEMEQYIKEHKEDISDELADVLYWTLLISHDLEIDIVQAIAHKLEKTEKKYPVEKSKNRHSK